MDDRICGKSSYFDSLENDIVKKTNNQIVQN
jgi:hypothetical protein